jgi:probable phosphoglycerate mutase
VRELVLVRHAETAWARAGRHTGRTDIPLTDAGRAAAAELRPGLAARAFDLVLVSPLGRARETAALAGVDAGAVLDDGLVEWDYGDDEGRTAVEIRAERPGWLVWTDGPRGGETPAQVAARADRVIERALGVDGDVCLVAHGHLLRMLAVRWLGADLELGAQLPLAPGRLGVLGFERDRRALRGWALPACPGPPA